MNALNIDMIVTDLDGTLLRSDKTVSDYSASVLKECQGRGIKFVYATARPMRSIKYFALKTKPDAMIIHNGAGVYIGDEMQSALSIPRTDAFHILRTLMRDFPECKLSAEIGDVLYANFDANQFWSGVHYTYADFDVLPGEGECPPAPVYKIIIERKTPDQLRDIESALPESVYCQPSEGDLILIMSRGATKLNGIKLLCERWGIPLARVAAFGDDHNDVEMLDNCGYGIATENAIAEVKCVAHFTCPDNDSDGVAQWLERHCK